MRRLIPMLLLAAGGVSYGSTAVYGDFFAQSACPAYWSKVNKTNPGDRKTVAGQSYTLVEINKNNNPDWYRIELPGDEYVKRWVSKACGVATYQIEDKQSCEKKPGLADSYVLALSWQPGFCQTYGYEIGKPECLTLPANSYPASHLVLHGLWPNQASCGENYGFCGAEPRKNHCDYVGLKFEDTVADPLRRLMPSFAAGSCLERHEWNKHGTCQTGSVNEYFAQALRLTQDADQTALGQFLHEQVGNTVSKKQLEAMIQVTFGEHSAKKVFLGCKNGVLVDIYIQLPAWLGREESLTTLVNSAPEGHYGQGCPALITISNFTH